MNEGKKQILWKLRKLATGDVYPNISFTILKAWIVEGRVEIEDELCNSEAPEWAQAGKIPELRGLFVPETNTSDIVSTKDLGYGWQPVVSEDVEMDMTPMMDCTFLLLIFFIVSATFAIHEVKSIIVPKASYTQATKQEKTSITVAVNKERQVFVGKELVELKDLKQYLMAEVSKSTQQELILSADHSLDYGFIVEVMDEINGAGVKDIKLKLQKKEKS